MALTILNNQKEQPEIESSKSAARLNNSGFKAIGILSQNRCKVW